jgi:hypothetical protein
MIYVGETWPQSLTRKFSQNNLENYKKKKKNLIGMTGYVALNNRPMTWKTSQVKGNSEIIVVG